MHLDRIYVRPQMGFTLAEVLITLVIIGIIASMTIPTIMANSRRTEVETKLKQVHSILNNTLTKAVADHGPAYTWDEMGAREDKIQVDFFDKYTAPYLKLAKERGEADFKKMGYKNGIKKSNGEPFSSADTTGFKNFAVLQNGMTIIAISPAWGYGDLEDPTIPTKYVSTMYAVDINGAKGQNTVGKDIFYFCIFTFTKNPRYDTMGLLTVPHGSEIDKDKYWDVNYKNVSKEDRMAVCKSSGLLCGSLIQANGWKIPKDYPLKI